MESSLKAKIILCDIEGTTSSISFVKDTLFSYARKHVDIFLKNNWNDETVKSAVKDLQTLSKKDVDDKIEGAIEIIEGDVDSAEKIGSIVKNFEFLMNNDRKVAPLKTLQGLIWEQGYKDASIKGHVFEDVAKSFDAWTSTGHKVFIYSSGSVAAQKLLFEFSSAGNLLKYLSGHFDTAVGPKREKESYAKICKELDDGVVPTDVVFLTDIIEEAKAAKEAGLHTIVLNRPGNMSFTDEDKQEFNIVDSFTDITFETVTGNKRKIDADINDQEPPSKVVKTDSIVEDNGDTKFLEEKTVNIEKKADILEDTVDNKKIDKLTVSDIKVIEKTSEITLLTDNKTEIKEDKDCPITETEAMETDVIDVKILPTSNILYDGMEVEEAKDTEIVKDKVEVLEVSETNNIKSAIVEGTKITDENTAANKDEIILCETDLKTDKTDKGIITEDVTIENYLDIRDIKEKNTDSTTEANIETNSIKFVETSAISEKTLSEICKTEIEKENTNEKVLTEKYNEQNIAEEQENKETIENVINNETVKINDINCTENGKETGKQEKNLIKNYDILLFDKHEETPLPLPLDSETTTTTSLPEILGKTALTTENSLLSETMEKSVPTEKAEEKSIVTDKQINTGLPTDNIKEDLKDTDQKNDVEKCDEDSNKIKTVLDDKNVEDESSKKNCDSDKENDVENNTEPIKTIDGKAPNEILTDDAVMSKV